MKIFDLSDPAKPVYIRDFGLLGQQPGATSFQGVRAGIGIHGPISAGVARNRVYAAYGTGANGVIQTNNVEVDDRGLIYSADRAGTGQHIIRLTGRAAQVAAK